MPIDIHINRHNKIMNLSQLKKSQLVPPQPPAQSFKPMQKDSNDKEKPLFLSRAQRFGVNLQNTPGPGAYDGIIKQKHTLDFRVAREKKPERQIAKEYQWIFSSGRLSLPTGTNKNIGPGLYHPEHSPTESSHSSWAKNQRFNEAKSFKNPLGPGQYENSQASLAKKEKISQLAVFKSKSPRTFFEEIIQKEKKLEKKHNPEDEDGEKFDQVVKFDETSYPVRKKVEKLSPVFLSKCVRPQLINDNSNERIGPGSYSLSLERNASQKSTGIISAMHYNINALIDRKPEALTSKIAPPGPGAYQTETASSEVIKKKPLGVIAREERFKANLTQTKNSMPGPGEYMQKRYTMINEEEFILNNKNAFARNKPDKAHDFGTVARATLRNHNNVPFGEYNVQIFDMNYKIKKQKQHYEKLKMMEVTLPAFNSKHHH